MRAQRLVLLIILSVWGVAAVWADEEPFLQHARFDSSQTYYLYVPANYSADKPWPLFIAVHGGMASGLGDFTMWKQYADPEGFILLAPNFVGQYRLLGDGSDARLLRIVEELERAYHVDRKKILLSGFSWGGQFAYRLTMKYPSFAHTVAIFNSGDFPDPIPAYGSTHPRFYLAVGSEEKVFPEQLARHVAALKAAGYAVESYLAQGVGHSIPSKSVTDVLRLFRGMKAERASQG